MSQENLDLPLSGTRVVEIADGKTDMCGRLLADLGAEVILVEPPQGAVSRRVGPMVSGINLYFATHAANKNSVVLDFAKTRDRSRFRELIASADILVNASTPEFLDTSGIEIERLRVEHPALVILSISDFGQTGPYRNFCGDNATHLALAGVLARSGIGGQPPLLPPGKLAYETTAVQAAWCALLALWQQRQTGSGDHLDFSIFEATAQIIDPALGVTGSAAGGKSAADMAPRGRPEKFPLYPTFQCSDGYVRVCILNPRQWQGMSEWLGDDHPFTDDKYGNLSSRYAVLKDINVLIAALFSLRKKVDLVTEGQRRGIPITAVATLSEVLTDEHFRARGAFRQSGLKDNENGECPSGYLEIDGQRAGIRRLSPQLGEHNDSLVNSPRRTANTGRMSDNHRPLQNLRVLDLGIIVAGAELGRLFADQGADVIKVENSQYPDGLRQSLTGEPMTVSFAQGQRGKRSLGLNLRSEKGRQLFIRLVEQSDVVLSNFKPGTMESLGLGYDVLSAHNPRIVMFDSSALGNTGPLAKTMGYGPLVRATTGLTGLWRYPEQADSFSDGITIYPDHFAARIAATGILATLIRRQRTGRGGTVSQSQAEAILVAMSEYILHESLAPGSIKPGNNDAEYAAPYGVFPCAGDDEWCTIGIHNDQQWQLFCDNIGMPNLADDDRYRTAAARWQHRDALADLVSDWTSQKSPNAVMQSLQARRIPAARMQRIEELAQDPHLRSRGFFRTLKQPQLSQPLVTENGPVGRSSLPDPDIRPAPTQFQHTREIARELLALADADIETLIESRDIEVQEESA